MYRRRQSRCVPDKSTTSLTFTWAAGRTKTSDRRQRRGRASRHLGFASSVTSWIIFCIHLQSALQHGVGDGSGFPYWGVARAAGSRTTSPTTAESRGSWVSFMFFILLEVTQLGMIRCWRALSVAFIREKDIGRPFFVIASSRIYSGFLLIITASGCFFSSPCSISRVFQTKFQFIIGDAQVNRSDRGIALILALLSSAASQPRRWRGAASFNPMIWIG